MDAARRQRLVGVTKGHRQPVTALTVIMAFHRHPSNPQRCSLSRTRQTLNSSDPTVVCLGAVVDVRWDPRVRPIMQAPTAPRTWTLTCCGRYRGRPWLYRATASRTRDSGQPPALPKVRGLLADAGWDAEQLAAPSAAAARDHGRTHLGDDAGRVIATDGIDVLVEATGDPRAGLRHAVAAIDAGRHVVMVTVEADAVAGPLLAERGRMQPKMFNSFIDGSKSAIEMTAVCNATGLVPQPDGLSFPPVARDELAHHLRPRAAGGLLEMEPGGDPVTEVVSSLRRDGSPVPHDLRMGTYVVVEAGQDYVARCIREYGLQADAAGAYLALYRPDHLIGLELERVGGVRRPARRAHGSRDRVPLRRGGGRQARPGRRRGAGR